MMGRILMAERRGLLRGKYISPVQEAALYLVMYREVEIKERDLINQITASFVRTPADVPELFPWLTGMSAVGEPTPEITVEEVDDFEGELRFPDFDPREAERILSEIGPSGTMTLQEIDNEWR